MVFEELGLVGAESLGQLLVGFAECLRRRCTTLLQRPLKCFRDTFWFEFDPFVLFWVEGFLHTWQCLHPFLQIQSPVQCFDMPRAFSGDSILSIIGASYSCRHGVG